MTVQSCADCSNTERRLLCPGEWSTYRHRKDSWCAHTGCRVFRCVSCWRARKKDQRQKRHDRTIAGYGLTREQYEALKTAQGGRCAIAHCHATGYTKNLSIEHDHACEASHGGVIMLCCIRGLTCGMHNEWIGRAVDDPAVFDSLADHLRNGKARVQQILRGM